MTRPPRQHGTYAMRRRGECSTNPCQACTDAARRYRRRTTKLRTMGHPPYIDAEPARQHVQALLAEGMTTHQIEAASGIHRTAIRVMLGDFPNRAQTKRIRPATEQALLKVRLNLGEPVGHATVDGAGTRRRLQALQAIGYPSRDLARMLGNGPHTPLQIARQPRVRAATARAVAALYTELENTVGPSHRTAVTARARGYLTPGWWDPDTIDDPREEPEGLRTYGRDSGRLVDDVSATRLARIELLRRRGYSRQQIADRLGVPLRYVSRDLLEARSA
jgi:hypothetical protein